MVQQPRARLIDRGAAPPAAEVHGSDPEHAARRELVELVDLQVPLVEHILHVRHPARETLAPAVHVPADDARRRMDLHVRVDPARVECPVAAVPARESVTDPLLEVRRDHPLVSLHAVPGAVNLYSDTQTRPSEGMRRAIATADVGDEQRREDPTTRQLEERVAELLGQEAGLFLPSGTMCNQIALRLHARPGGDELILDRTAHPIIAEAGGPAWNAGLMIHALDGDGGIFTGDQVRAAIRPDSRYMPRSRVVSVEQTTNMGGGRVWPLESVHEVLEAAREHGLRTHMDGARLMNAVVASGVSAAEYAGGFDTAWLDFTKGLGAPVGAVLCGSRELIGGGLALEAADGRGDAPGRHRRGRLPLRARPQRRAPGGGPRRTRERSRPVSPSSAARWSSPRRTS